MILKQPQLNSPENKSFRKIKFGRRYLGRNLPMPLTAMKKRSDLNLEEKILMFLLTFISLAHRKKIKEVALTLGN